MPEGKGKQGSKLAGQQQEVKASVQEQPLREKAPVHCPLEEELPAKVKGPSHIATWVGKEEREPQEDLEDRRRRGEGMVLPCIYSG